MYTSTAVRTAAEARCSRVRAWSVSYTHLDVYKRQSLAGVMVDQVKILLFDEPLANLDPATGKQAIELIDEIQKDVYKRQADK